MMKYPLLSKIKAPSDLQDLNLNELKDLATEIRGRIIETMSINGGHLASNLGTVELTLALHTVFSSPQDKFIFDVSHQTYTHKLITGRNDARFDKIRKPGGLSGFAHPQESEHDHFFAGHAGTALSLALGMAHARNLAKAEEHVIPIIGDASLTCGLSLEALNNIHKDLGKFIVVLNDNAMSISRNVGGITNMLSRLLSNPTTSKWVHELESLLAKIPHYGTSLGKLGQKFSESVKNLVSSAPFFEHFGLSYIGPVDGHDLNKMIAVFQAIKDLPMPVILHLYTKKGQGLSHAENDPITYHGVKPFDPATCEFLPSTTTLPSFPKVFGKHLLKMGEKDPNLAIVTPAMSLGSCLDPFMNKYPERSWDVGIAEGHAVTFAGGLAKSRVTKVFCSIYATFFQRAFDNLFQDVCLQKIPVVFAVDRAGLATSDGATHHGIYDIGFLKTMPNLVICQPRDGHVLKELMESAHSWEKPVVIRYPNIATKESTAPLRHRVLGQAEMLAEGEDLLIISLGHMCEQALSIREILHKKGVSVACMDPVFVKPLDINLLSHLLLKFQKIVTIEEHCLNGGLGAEVNQFLISHGFTNCTVLNLGIPDVFFDHSEQLHDEMGLTAPKMAQKILTHFSLSLNTIGAY